MAHAFCDNEVLNYTQSEAFFTTIAVHSNPGIREMSAKWSVLLVLEHFHDSASLAPVSSFNRDERPFNFPLARSVFGENYHSLDFLLEPEADGSHLYKVGRISCQLSSRISKQTVSWDHFLCGQLRQNHLDTLHFPIL